MVGMGQRPIKCASPLMESAIGKTCSASYVYVICVEVGAPVWAVGAADGQRFILLDAGEARPRYRRHAYAHLLLHAPDACMQAGDNLHLRARYHQI